MPVNSQERPRYALLMPRGIAPALVALALIWQGAAAGGDSGPESVAELLSTAKAQALAVRSDFSTISFFARSEDSWKSHSAIINLYKEHLSALRLQAGKLDAARGAASPSQKITIERIEPLLQELAAHAAAVIDRIGENSQRLGSGEYNDYLKLSSDLTAELAALVAGYVDYGQTRQQLDRVLKEPGAAARSF